MSTPSLDKLVERIGAFFWRLCEAHGWKDVRSLDQQWGTRFSALKALKTACYTPVDLELRIELIPSESGRDLVLSSMYFQDLAYTSAGGSMIMAPTLFLEYHGRRFQTINPDAKVNDKICWHVGTPKDLDAFLEGYDRLAKRLGFVTLFE